jgi:ABC-type sugar transport system ATPase subunit
MTDGSLPSAASVAVNAVVKRFPDSTVALDHVALEAPPGKISVLVGPSGCGKTTLLRIIAGLDSPTSGSVTIDGQDVAGLPSRRRGVAMVFQDYALYPDKTVVQNIEFPLRMARVPRSERRARVSEIARTLQIDDLLHRRPAQLSGGQRQRVAIGRALIRNPRVLLMDEPLSSLDAKLRNEMRGEIVRLQRAIGVTILYVTHDQTEALTLADHVAILRAGRVEQVGAPRSVFARPATRFVGDFLGSMNLLTVAVEPAGIRLQDGTLTRCPAPLGTVGQPAVLGVRSEALTLGDHGDLTLRGPVVLTELLGTEQLIHVEVAGAMVRARLPANQPLSDHVSVTAHAEELHLFAAGDDGHRLDFPLAGDRPPATPSPA